MRSRILSLVVLCITSAGPRAPWAALDMNVLTEKLRDQEFESALQLIEDEEPGAEGADYLAYLRANTFYGMEKWEEAA